MKVNFGGIKCDDDNCDYRDEDVSVSDYPKYINKPCPYCGSNLLTKEDFDALNKLLETLEIAKQLENFMIENNMDVGPTIKMKADFNGTGKVKITQIPIDDNQPSM